MTLAQRGAQAAFLLAALFGFLAGGAFTARNVLGLTVPGMVPLVILVAGAGLAAYAVGEGRKLLLTGGVVLLFLGALDTSTIHLNGWAVAYAAALVAAVELAFGHDRGARIPDPTARATLMARYFHDLRVVVPFTLVVVVAGAGLFLVAGPVVPDAFEASLERLSAFGVLASGLLVAALVIAYGLAARALRRRSARRFAEASATPVPVARKAPAEQAEAPEKPA